MSLIAAVVVATLLFVALVLGSIIVAVIGILVIAAIAFLIVRGAIRQSSGSRERRQR
jgi:large-conductance mechanosensitive channel